jgi:uncharacterized membrane protein YkvA (DUF1232 family)
MVCRNIVDLLEFIQMSDNNSLLPFDDLSIEPLTQTQIEQRSPDWYETWRARIHDWISTHADDEFAQIVLLVPDLLALVVRLARDKRVPFRLKGQLILAAAYVLSPFDLVPEALLGVIGLADDAGVLVLVLIWIKGLASVDPQVLRDNWSGAGDVLDVIDSLHNRINANAERLYNPQVWRTLQARFGRVKRGLLRRRAES